MRTRIDHATVLLPEGPFRTSVLIEDGRIAAIDLAEHTGAEERVSARGLHLIPGVIDDQVHFREPGLTHKEDLRTGSQACAKGGITSFLEMPNTRPATTTCQRLEEKLALAATKSWVNYGFYMGATVDNLVELQNAQRTPGIKIFIGSSTGELLVDEQSALERIFAETTLPITAHCEDEAIIRRNTDRYRDRHDVAVHSLIRDHEAAMVASRRAIDLSIRHRHPFHLLHVSTAAEVELLRSAPAWVTAEACPHHLFLNIDDYGRLGSRAQMNPSLKTAADNQALWEGLLDGTIDLVATDHAPHTLEEKAQPYPLSPSGMPLVENVLAMFLHQVHLGRCSLEQVVRWMCTTPARVWNIPLKGEIRVGYDADLVLVDLAKSETVRDSAQLTKSGWSAWDGCTLVGWPVRTWVGGDEVYRDGQLASQPRGREIRFERC